MKTTDISSQSSWELITQQDADTLFVDRESIIARNASELSSSPRSVSLSPDFLAVAPALADKFRHIIMVSSSPLEDGAEKTLRGEISRQVGRAGGRVDAYYTEESAAGASAHPILALKARRDYPDINLANSVLVGDSVSHRQFAFNCGMQFVDISGVPGVDQDSDIELVEKELTMVRNGLMQTMDVMAKFMNSAVRINGVRLGLRCLCHAIAGGHRGVIVCSKDSGIDTASLVANLDTVIKGSTHSKSLVVVSAHSEVSVSGQLEKILDPGDVVYFFAVNPSAKAMVEASEKARDLGAVTVSVTGAKPGGLDRTDVVVKIPSTSLGQVQAMFKVIMASGHLIVWNVIQDRRIF